MTTPRKVPSSGPPHICVIGYLSIDTISLAGRTFGNVPGGAALYAALGARAAGATVSLVALAGEDYPQAWIDQMATCGIDVSRVGRAGGPTRRARLSHMARGERMSPHHDDDQWWDRTRALAPHMPGDIDADGIALSPMPAAIAVQAARAARCPVTADTSAAFVREDAEAILELLPHLACFAPSLEETRLLLPGTADSAALRDLAARGPDVVQKRGAAGIAICARGQDSVRLVRAPATEEVDPTGAGDAAVGALAAGLASGLPLLRASQLAAGVGARAVSGRGPSALGFNWDLSSSGLSS
jgi:sugar/nucleoside kinase (ribokinase family)